MKLATWNAEWAKASGSRGRRVAAEILSCSSEIFVLTEGYRSLFPAHGHVVGAGDDWGYDVKDKSQRKVLMWSENPWTEVDVIGSPRLPSGRFVSAITETTIGPIRIIGVCIPFSMAHVASGGKNRDAWEDHKTYLCELKELLIGVSDPYAITGDYNQRIPAGRQPKNVAALLDEVLHGLVVPTAGHVDPPLIDHIAHSSDIVSKVVRTIPASNSEGKLSDHTGVVVELSGL
jgi:endonuclease/exonuclease/phosphatase family metal-dependent hydrolase